MYQVKSALEMFRPGLITVLRCSLDAARSQRVRRESVFRPAPVVRVASKFPGFGFPDFGLPGSGVENASTIRVGGLGG